MHEERAFLRGLLAELIKTQPNAEGLYIPRGEEGMRRMIRALLCMRLPEPEGTRLFEEIKRFEAIESENRKTSEL